MEVAMGYIKKAVLLWLTLFVISITFGFSIYSNFSSKIYANVFESMNNSLQFAESTYDIFMNQMKMGMIQASVEPAIKDMILGRDGVALGNLLLEWGKQRHYVSEWYIIEKDGGIIASSSKKNDLLLVSGNEMKIHSIIERSLSTGEVISGTELVSINSRADEFTLIQYVIVPVLENAGGTIGGIVTAMDLEKDSNIVGKIMHDTGMYSVITAGDRIIASNLDSVLYRFNTGAVLPANIEEEVLQKGIPFIKSTDIYSSRMNDSNEYFAAFRPIKGIEGNIIGTQGIIYHDRMAENTLKRILNFTVIVVALLIAVFSFIAWLFLKTQWLLLKEKQVSNRLSIIKKFTDTVRQAASEDEVYDILFELLKKNSNITQAIVMRKEYEDRNLTMYKALYDDIIGDIKDHRISEDNCMALKAGKEFTFNNANSDFSCNDFPGEAESYICLPIILGGIVSGVIQIQSDRKDFFTGDMVSIIKIYIDTITPVISNLRLVDSLNRLALIDTLTKIYNRRYLEKYIEEQIILSRSKDLHFCVIMMDIDFFKKFNDDYGHDAGDYVLMHFADTIKHNIREGDIAARYGGEEFVVVLSRTGIGAAYGVAEKLRKRVEGMSLVAISSENPPGITCSLGISCYPLHGNSLGKLIQSADKALYEAKNSGRNKTCVFGGEKI